GEVGFLHVTSKWKFLFSGDCYASYNISHGPSDAAGMENPRVKLLKNDVMNALSKTSISLQNVSCE
ncbi:hypothetical protein ACJX0J_039836, partial [Zea mays]